MLRRALRAVAVSVLLLHAGPAWAQSPSPSASPSTGRSAGGSIVALLVFVALVGLLVFYRRRVLEPFSRRYSNPPPEVPPRGGPDGDGEDRPIP